MHDGRLIGDSGYACRHFLMTPYRNPQLIYRQRFNDSLTRTRVKIEQTFGVLKRRFSCLHGESRMSPARVCQQVTACAILHNVAVEHRDVELPPPGEFEQEDNVHPLQLAAHGEGQRTRERLALTFFGK